jgi:hypothetical protein
MAGPRIALAPVCTMIALMLAPLTAHAQVVTPSSLNGWALFDGSSGSDPAAITGAQPFNGTGSLQYTINASNQQPAAAYGFASPFLLSSLTSLSSFGFSFLTPLGMTPAASPTLRLLLTGIGGNPNSRTDGSLGWYLNGAAGAWDTETFSLTSGNFFLRLGGTGQAANDCRSAGSSFDDRRQTIQQWEGVCTGSPAYDLRGAAVVGIEVDWGTFVNPTTSTSYADNINWSNFGQNSNHAFNFELTSGGPTDVVPEPATMSLLGTGLVGLLGAGVKRRKRK